MKNIKKQSRLGNINEWFMFSEIYNLDTGLTEGGLPYCSYIRLDKLRRKTITKDITKTPVKRRKTTLEDLKYLAASENTWTYPTLKAIIRKSDIVKEEALKEFRKRGFIEESSMLSTEGAILDRILCNRRVNKKTQAHVTRVGFKFILYTLECIHNNTYDESSTVDPT